MAVPKTMVDELGVLDVLIMLGITAICIVVWCVFLAYIPTLFRAFKLLFIFLFRLLAVCFFFVKKGVYKINTLYEKEKNSKAKQ